MNHNANDDKYREICEVYSERKVISGIVNEKIKVKYTKSNIWLVTLVPFAFALCCLHVFENGFSVFCVYIAFIAVIMAFLSQRYKISFKNNSITSRNIFGKKEEIELGGFPYIYVDYYEQSIDDRYFSTCELHIEKNSYKMIINIKSLGAEKTKKILDNLQLEDIKEEEKVKSSDKEKIFLNYQEFLNKNRRIIDIKNPNVFNEEIDEMEQKKLINYMTLVIILVIILLIIFIAIPGIISKILLIGVLAIISLGQFQEIFFKYKHLKILLTPEGNLKIDNYILNFRENEVMIYIEKDEKLKSHYILKIRDNEQIYDISLSQYDKSILEKLISNLLFEEKT